MPSQQSGMKPPTRTRASMACINCRLRKIKCDVQKQPPESDCTPCRASHAPCHIDSGGDRRKRRGVGENLSAVHSRLAALEDLLRGQGALSAQPNEEEQRPAPSSDQNTGTLAPRGTSPLFIPPNQGRQPDTGLESTEMAGGALLLNESVQMLDRQPSTRRSPEFPSLPEGSQDMFNIALDFPEQSITVEGHPGSRSQNTVLSPPYDTISQFCMPQPRLFGIMPSLMKETQSSDFDAQQSRYQMPQTHLFSDFDDSASLVAEDAEDEILLSPDSTQLRKVLLQTFWDVHTSGIPVVDKDRFMSHRSVGKRSQFYSTFLENAILACASRTSTSSPIRRLGGRFLECAQAELLRELESPNLASMQGLIMLSECVGTRGNDRLSWMYCGMACRLVFDLGLLHKPADLGDEESDSVDATHRICVFLSAFVFDQNLSLYFGRLHSMTLEQLRSALQTAKNVSVPENLQAWSLLSVQVARITDILNSATSADVTDHLHLFPKLAAELDACYDNLPRQLKHDDPSSKDLDASSYGLKLQFHGVRIVLHRLWIRLRESTEDNSASGVGTGQRQSMDQSAWIVHWNAIRVAKLMRTYTLLYGVEKIVTVMLINTCWATWALTSHILSPPTDSPPPAMARKTGSNDSHTDIHWLKFLWKTLEDVQEYYPLTASILTMFARLIEGTHLYTTLRAQRYSDRQALSPSAIFTSSTGNSARSSVEALMHDVSYGLGTSPKPSTISDGMFLDLSTVENSWIFNQHGDIQMSSAC